MKPILQIDIGGKMAHFRKYYANNTAMSFCLPPRTTIMGILAAYLGLPKGSYHTDLASENIAIGIRLLSPIKKQFHRLNYLSIKTKEDFNGKAGRIQTPVEIVSGLDIAKDEVVYRLYIAIESDTGQEVFNKLCKAFINREQVYPLCLGVANFTAYLRNAVVFEQDEVKMLDTQDWVTIDSAVPSKLVKNLDFNKRLPNGKTQSIEEEMSSKDFEANSRKVRAMCTVLTSTSGHSLVVKLKQPYFVLSKINQETQQIVFLT